ncbi:MAG: NTP transferase domain-containing protein [Longimicrobiales bacterium]
MWAVIPVAGQGSRLRRVTSGRPKCLLDVGGRPLLHHLLDQMSTVCEAACVVLPPEHEGIRDALAQHPFGQGARTVVQEVPNGLADAVSCAANLVPGRAFVVMGDTFFGASLEPALRGLEAQEGGLLIDPNAPDPGEPAGWAEPDGAGFARGVSKGGRPKSDWVRIAGGFVLDSVTLGGLRNEDTGAGFEASIHASIEAGARYRLLPFDGARWNVNTPEQLSQLRAWYEG